MEFLSGRIFRNAVLLVMPVDLARIITIKQLTWRVTYRIEGEVGFHVVNEGGNV